ncbi:MAG: S-methyl-5-thioribose-1-phosphate isomerase [Proteobacteria bacterium]|nr:S-methyl-5-thioribose-1-phosphate isomerase [Desulfobulbaceae bacterium]MBU4152079.1 S-methyl-5-thioribose-1-phosphate isomerase [Pseudomonadota bacterium]MDP2106328.1 S-methyl-5-thioribose-1-phosphate isomerase [Desulfobulbaceae bacterium]
MHINGQPYRTIWIKPDDSSVIQIIDQRHLPHQFIIEDLKTVNDFALAIQEMHVRGAGLIGATAGFGMYAAALAAPAKGTQAALDQSARILLATRPTAKNLAWAVARQQHAMAQETTMEAKRARSLDVAREIADEDADFCRRIGDHGLSIIRQLSEAKGGRPVNILTHCNAGWLAFVDYGSATAPIYAAHQAGIPVHVWVDETRPWLQGSRLTAWELGQEDIPHTLIPDNTGGHLMQHGLVDMVIVGTDRTTRSGDVANKIGTYLKALAANDNKIPFYVALPSSTFDWAIRDGIQEIPIEERPDTEIRFISGLTGSGSIETVLIAPVGTRGANYGFDVTPARLITALITERGITPAREADILALYPEQHGTT